MWVFSALLLFCRFYRSSKEFLLVLLCRMSGVQLGYSRAVVGFITPFTDLSHILCSSGGQLTISNRKLRPSKACLSNDDGWILLKIWKSNTIWYIDLILCWSMAVFRLNCCGILFCGELSYGFRFLLNVVSDTMFS